jgi:saccharopine dehydrogenase-like NADP-dependent oxidoreductase
VSEVLARRGRFKELVLTDLHIGQLRRAASSMQGSNVRARRLDALDREEARDVLRDASVMVNCTTYHLGLRLLRTAIALGVNYVDLGGLYNTPRQLELDARAKKAGVVAVIGCGATPGLTNVMARLACESLDRPREVNISFASHRDLVPSPGLLDTILDEFRPGVARYYWERGRLVDTQPFSGARDVRFPPPLGTQTVYFVPHSETHTLPRALRGLEMVAVRGTWRAEDMALLRVLSELGLTSENHVRVDGRSVRPIDVLRALLLERRPDGGSKPWAFFLDVEVVGDLSGRRKVIAFQAAHPIGWGRNSTARMTALPAAISAELVAAGAHSGEGVMAPEAAFDPSGFARALRAEGIRIRRRRVVPAKPGTAT